MKLKVVIQNNVYQMNKTQFLKLIKQIKTMTKNKRMLLAIKKDRYVELRKDNYNTKLELEKAVKNWNQKGYCCYTN